MNADPSWSNQAAPGAIVTVPALTSEPPPDSFIVPLVTETLPDRLFVSPICQLTVHTEPCTSARTAPLLRNVPSLITARLPRSWALGRRARLSRR